MTSFNGKTIVFSDMHCGLSGNKVSRLNICAKAVEEMTTFAEREGVENMIFGGDWFHSRSMLDNNTINVSLRLVSALAKRCRLALIVGNHDAYLKNSTDINSINIFRDTPNVTVIDRPEEVLVNGQRFLLVPWLSDMSKYSPESFDAMVGHFEISSKYLMQSYVEEHSAAKASAADSAKVSAVLGKPKSADLIGNFVDLVRKGGTVYAGHIHTRKEFSVRDRDFVFIGSPYQQNLGDIGSDRGFYVLDESNTRKFVKITAPEHVQVFMSEALKPGYDFSKCAGSIVQKVYDVDVKPSEDNGISQRITDFKPYEELLPDYRVAISRDSNTDDGVIELIRKSKLDYMRNYVDNIDAAALDEQGVDREDLFETLERYYKKVAEA